MRRFHLDINAAKGDIVELPPETSHHISHVLRLKAGAEVIFFDGRGTEYLAKLLLSANDILQVAIIDKISAGAAPKVKVILAQALITNDKLDSVLQKSTELGAQAIIPFTCQRSLPNLKTEQLEKKLFRWQKIVAEAARQSERNSVPLINPPQKWSELIDYPSANTLKIIACARESQNQLKSVLLSVNNYDTILLLIGPEGGFTDSEEKEAIAKGFVPVSLGKNILRTETAGPAALAMLAFYFT